MLQESDRMNGILANRLYRECLQKNLKCEESREFCRHDMEHFLAVARIAYIINLERGLKIKKDVIYAAALLHDIGRWKQYEEGIPHDEAGAKLALEILEQSGYEEHEIRGIVNAIRTHRIFHGELDTLEEIIYYGDKKSRNCFNCQAVSRCNWQDEKKNFDIKY